MPTSAEVSGRPSFAFRSCDWGDLGSIESKCWMDVVACTFLSTVFDVGSHSSNDRRLFNRLRRSLEAESASGVWCYHGEARVRWFVLGQRLTRHI